MPKNLEKGNSWSNFAKDLRVFARELYDVRKHKKAYGITRIITNYPRIYS